MQHFGILPQVRRSPAAQTVILGAGPAGLTAAYLLSRRSAEPVVLEAMPVVGGLARTEVRDGFRFDLGGHRFFTKSPEVEALWHETLGDELLLRPRLSRIYYRGRLIDYPLSGPNLIRTLGPRELGRALSSYLFAQARRRAETESYEDWVSKRFGRRLYEMFFRSYTEKVWGVPCTQLRAEWAAQRIRGLSFAAAVRSALPGRRDNGVRSLIEEFHYPRLGPGQMWETMRDRIVEMGGSVRTGAPIEGIRLKGANVSHVVAAGQAIAARQVISSLPLGVLVGLVEPKPPAEVADAAAGLRYRDFVTVALVLDGSELFPDNWIYVHDPGVRVARIQNFRAWSPAMVPDPDKACVGLEYFCFEGDDLWSLPNEMLVELATRELAAIGLCAHGRVLRGHVVRVPKAYPIYDEEYAGRLDVISEWLAGIGNLQQVGRNGLHRYNNSDHSMLTAMRAVDNLYGANHDLWSVNADSWYHETEVAEELPYRSPPAAPRLAQIPGA
jgi:protoporphyrinogen oxidase